MSDSYSINQETCFLSHATNYLVLGIFWETSLAGGSMSDIAIANTFP